MESISFDRIAERYDETRGGMDRARDIAVGVVPVLAPGSVLEVGTGTGAIAAALAELGRPVVGVDLSPAMLHRAVVRLGRSVAVGDAHHLPVRTGSCDNVLLVWVMHLVGDPITALVEARRVLADGGRVVVAQRLEAPAEHVDDIEAIIDPMLVVLRRGRPGPTSLAAQAGAAGLVLVERTLSRSRPVDQSPLAVADNIASRTFSSLWDLDDAMWAVVVEPTLAKLRALPAPDQPRSCSTIQELLVFTAVDQ